MTISQVTPSWCSKAPFDTLDECLAFVRERHPQREVCHTATDPDTGEQHENRGPAYVFRGEVGWLGECLSRRERVRRGHFACVCDGDLRVYEQNVDRSLQLQLGLNPMLRTGLMQHYGWPTDFIDATSSLFTASFFARYGVSSDSERGAIGVFDVATLAKNAVIVNLSEHSTAVRPRRQEAYGIQHSRHRDLKQQQAISDMGITWYAFRTDPQHSARITKCEELLSVLNDGTAGLLRLFVDGAVSEHGQLRHSLAKYLSDRIAHCPVLMRATDDGHKLTTPAEAGIEIDNRNEIEESLRLWSRNHPDVAARLPATVGR